MTQTAKNYADALYELARDEGLDERVMQELTGVNALFAANPDYVRLLSASNVRREEQLAALDEAFSGRVHTYVCSFLKLLCERHHIRELPNCARRFRQRFNADHGILEASAVTARPLSIIFQRFSRTRVFSSDFAMSSKKFPDPVLSALTTALIGCV